MRLAHTISLPIDRPFDEVYDYLAKPANFQNWAAVEPGSFKPLDNGDWEGRMPGGLRHIRFMPPNNFGVFDHAVFAPGGPVIFTPMRVLANGRGVEVTFTYLQRDGMTEEQFASSVEWIQTDLLALKSLLEALR